MEDQKELVLASSLMINGKETSIYEVAAAKREERNIKRQDLQRLQQKKLEMNGNKSPQIRINRNGPKCKVILVNPECLTNFKFR